MYVCMYDYMHVYIFCTGGLGFSLHNIGISLGIVGAIMIPISVVAFAPVSDFVVHNIQQSTILVAVKCKFCTYYTYTVCPQILV